MLTNTAEERGTSKGRVDSFRYRQILLITSGLSERSEAYSARSRLLNDRDRKKGPKQWQTIPDSRTTVAFSLKPPRAMAETTIQTAFGG